MLLHVTDEDIAEAAHGAFAGLLGRGHPSATRDRRSSGWPTPPADDLLRAAADRLGRPARPRRRHGRVEREVVAAAEGAELLVVARDGDRTRLGPHSLGPPARFVVDHAPCPVLLVWPQEPPGWIPSHRHRRTGSTMARCPDPTPARAAAASRSPRAAGGCTPASNPPRPPSS